MKSMTGFGKATCELSGKKITVEIRSLNSRQLDLNMRVAPTYRDKEAEIRGELSRALERGKVDFSLYAEGAGEQHAAAINHPIALAYHKELKTLAELIGEQREDFLSLIIRMPDVMKQDKQEPDEQEWNAVNACIQDAIAAFQQFRNTEGQVLAQEFRQRINLLLQLLEDVVALDPQRAVNVRERLQKVLTEQLSPEKIDQNRFEQELIYYLEKFDITEEKLRLKTHCDYFLKVMAEPASGRKLGFIAQEIGREINTIGSKANDAGIQKLVVQMKDELEKIKEQLLNVL
jgi:uncharacterized protein (TIGR00255 family)